MQQEAFTIGIVGILQPEYFLAFCVECPVGDKVVNPSPCLEVGV